MSGFKCPGCGHEGSIHSVLAPESRMSFALEPGERGFMSAGTVGGTLTQVEALLKAIAKDHGGKVDVFVESMRMDGAKLVFDNCSQGHEMKPEARLRARCRSYLDKALPAPGWYSAIEHGRPHSGTPEQRAREWGRLAAQGVKAGIPDMDIRYLALVIGVELKAGKNKQSPAQLKTEAAFIANGCEYWVIRSVTELHDRLVAHLVPVPPSFRVMAMDYDARLAVPEPKKKVGGGKEKAMRPSRRAQKFAAAVYTQ